MKMLMMRALAGIAIVNAADHDYFGESREGFLFVVVAHFLVLSAVAISFHPKLG